MEIGWDWTYDCGGIGFFFCSGGHHEQNRLGEFVLNLLPINRNF